MTTTWNETTQSRYDEMLGVVPPATMTGGAFLMGEAYDFRQCAITKQIAHTYYAFRRQDGKFFEAGTKLTLAEFRAEIQNRGGAQ